MSARLIDPDRSYMDALAGRRGLRQIAISQIRRGDLVFYAFRPGLRASHLAIARARPHGGSLDTVEGNVSNAVRLQTRGLQFVVLAARRRRSVTNAQQSCTLAATADIVVDRA